MGELTKYQMEQIVFQVERKGEEIMDRLAVSLEKEPEKMRETNQKARIKYAAKLGLAYNEKIEGQIKSILTDQIIKVFPQKKITKKDLAICMFASRSMVSRVINRKLKGISIAFLVRMLMALGIDVSISFGGSNL